HLSPSSLCPVSHHSLSPFFSTPPSTTELSPLSLHDALPIFVVVDDGSTDPATLADLDRLRAEGILVVSQDNAGLSSARMTGVAEDRKSTRLNSSHVAISYAVFCLKKKKKQKKDAKIKHQHNK